MKKSKRSDVDPFIVMDVMESARIAEEKGKRYNSYGGRAARNTGT